MKPTALALVSAIGLALAPIAFGQHVSQPKPAYQVEFFLTSQKGTAAPVSHEFTLRMLAASGDASVTTGDKIPITTGEKQFSYQPIGVELHCVLMDEPAPAGEVPLNVQVSISSAVANGAAADGSAPTISNVSSHLATQVPVGRKESVASFDDATTHTHYQLAVLVKRADGGL